MVPFDMLGMVSYQCDSYYVRKTHLFQIFDFKYAVTLETGLWVHEVIDTEPMTSY